jgi:uncharacterized protein (TIGR01777 family)
LREVDGVHAVINLSGENLAEGRWTSERKEELRSSRVLSTRSLVAAIREARQRPAVLIQASGVGFYGTGDGTQEIDESFPPGDDFLATLCVAWEAEAHPVSALGCRLVILRNGVVLARDGGVAKKLALPFKLFAGGPVASGRQYMSWIHREDWIELVVWALGNHQVANVINATSPSPVTNAEFMKAFGRSIGRPSWLRVPAFVLRVVFGEMAGPALIEGQRAVPARARQLGFVFKHPAIDDALTDALNQR